MTTETNIVAKQENNSAAIPAVPSQAAYNTMAKASLSSMLFQPGVMEAMERMAETMSTATIQVPKHLQGKKGDCLAVVMQAMQWGMNPFVVAQKTHLVNNVLGYEAQLISAVAQNSGCIEGRFHYEYKGSGNSLECRVGAILKGEKEIQWGEWLSISSVTVKNSPLWKSNPAQQFSYTQTKNWVRLYCPGAILGVYDADEIGEIPAQEPKSKYAEVVVVEDTPNASNQPTPVTAEIVNETNGNASATVSTETPSKPAEEPKPKVKTPPREGYINATQWTTLKNAATKANASEAKLRSGMKLFFNIEAPKDIRIDKLNELIAWADNGCLEPINAHVEESVDSVEDEGGYIDPAGF